MIAVAIFSVSSIAFAGGILVKTSFYSQALDETRELHIYLPEDYDPGGSKHYPVVYFLHGANTDHTSIFNYPISLKTSLDQLIDNHKIQPVIAVAADASNPPDHGSWYSNSALFGNFEDYIVYDLVEFIETNYKAIPAREKRCIQGNSMGGFGCMKFGLKHSDRYKGVASHSGAFEFWTFFDPYWKNPILLQNSGPPYNFDPNAGFVTSNVFTMCGAFSPNLNNPPYYVDFILDSNGDIDPAVKAKWELHNPPYLAELLPPDSDLAIFFDCGEQDEFMFHPANVTFAEVLDKLGIPYEFQTFTGTHTNKLTMRTRIGMKKLHAFMMETTLVADTHTVPASTGATAMLHLTADWNNANRSYILVGSISGTSPGTPLPGGTVTLPINWDLFTNLIINMLNGPIFQNFLGVLDACGSGTATMNLPPIPGAAGLTMYFAYALNGPWDFVSNPVAIQIVP